MTVNGADTLGYTYDSLGRLIKTTFRGKDATYAYDIAGRLTQKTLPNGAVQKYSYDPGNRLTQIAYQKGDGSPLETINYTYDANGNIIVKDQGIAAAPETPFSAQYDAGNRLTQITFKPGTAQEATYTLSYDASGFLTKKSHATDPSDVTTYTWDAKGRLTGLSGQNLQATYRYDALGRRIEKTVNGQSVGYLYDGSQAIAELVGSSVNAAYHPGVQIDEILARYTAAGQRTMLQDALGSVIAQVAEDGSTATRYAYSPYGEVQVIGPDEGNPLQYTGRENDGTGLYYYRARYYDPLLKRFISEDPIGLAGGINVYGYVGGNPVGGRDPSGNVSWGGGLAALAVVLQVTGTVDFVSTLTEVASSIKDRIDSRTPSNDALKMDSNGVPAVINDLSQTKQNMRDLMGDYKKAGDAVLDQITPGVDDALKAAGKACKK